MEFIPKATKKKSIIREKIIIYLDLTTDLLKKRKFIKAIDLFVKTKLDNNPHHSFDLFYFDDESNPVIQENLKSPKEIRNLLQNAWKSRGQKTSHFENGLFFCLSGIASSFLEQAITFRLLVISDLPSQKNSTYVDALMNLVETVRTFPTFIDIIRVGNERLYKDDVKLRVITTLTNGGLFYVSDADELKNALLSLIKNKALPDLRPEGGQAIDENHREYYEDLAVNLESPPPTTYNTLNCSICEQKICQYCNSLEDPIKICPSCGYALHECCGALYTWNYNIGLKHIFRCPDCGTLIKMDRKIVYQINGEKIPTKEIEEQDLTEIEEQEETWSPNLEKELTSKSSIEKEGSVQTSEPTIVKKTENKQETNQKQPQIKMGLFGPIKQVSSSSTQSKSKSIAKAVETPKIDHKEEPEEKKPPSSLLTRRRKRTRSSTMVCPVCSNYIKPGTSKCPKCGCPIRN